MAVVNGRDCRSQGEVLRRELLRLMSRAERPDAIQRNRVEEGLVEWMTSPSTICSRLRSSPRQPASSTNRYRLILEIRTLLCQLHGRLCA